MIILNASRNHKVANKIGNSKACGGQAITSGKAMSDPKQILQIESEIKKSIARRLHQDLIQSLATLAMRAGLSLKIAREMPEDVQAEVAKLDDLARNIVKESRYLLYILDPSPLYSEGLATTLEEWREQFEGLHGVKIELEFQDGLSLGRHAERDHLIFSTVVEVAEGLLQRGQRERLKIILGNDEDGIRFSLHAPSGELPESLADRVERFSGRVEVTYRSTESFSAEFYLPRGLEGG